MKISCSYRRKIETSQPTTTAAPAINKRQESQQQYISFPHCYPTQIWINNFLQRMERLQPHSAVTENLTSAVKQN